MIQNKHALRSSTTKAKDCESRSQSIIITIHDDGEFEKKQMPKKHGVACNKYLFYGLLLSFVFIAGFILFANANTNSKFIIDSANDDDQNGFEIGERNLLGKGRPKPTYQCKKCTKYISKKMGCNHCGNSTQNRDVNWWGKMLSGPNVGLAALAVAGSGWMALYIGGIPLFFFMLWFVYNHKHLG